MGVFVVFFYLVGAVLMIMALMMLTIIRPKDGPLKAIEIRLLIALGLVLASLLFFGQGRNLEEQAETLKALQRQQRQK